MSAAAVVVLATVRHDIARYLSALFLVYLILIFAYVVLNIVFSMGVRMPYWRWLHLLYGFLRDVVEPYLRIFRRFLPMFGPLDLSPWVATIVLVIVRGLVVSLVNG